MRAWMLSWKNIDPSRMFSTTYLKEDTAYKAAAESAAGWAKDELAELEAQDNPDDWQEYIDHLREVLNLYSQGKHKEAYEEWREYADDTTPDDDVMIEDTEVVEE